MTDFNELEKLKVFICNYFKITIEEIECKKRNALLSTARDFYIWIAKNYSHDHEDIAATINRDRSTAWSSLKRTSERRSIYPDFRKEIDRVEQEYKSINN